MNILDFDYDTEHGFAWIIVDGRKPGEKLTIQCCLADRDSEDAEAGKDFESKIIAGDCGHDWGSCGDANEEAFEYYGQNRCMTALFNKAKEAGLQVVGL